MEFLRTLADTALSTMLDVAPIVVILVVFQVAVLRRKPPNLRRIVAGFVLVLLGLTLFLIGLEQALFPIGETMARQLTAPETIGAASLVDGVHWHDYLLVYAFAAAIGFATTVAEPSLIASALKAEEVSGGAVGAWGLRTRCRPLRGGARRRNRVSIADRGCGRSRHTDARHHGRAGGFDMNAPTVLRVSDIMQT